MWCRHIGRWKVNARIAAGSNQLRLYSTGILFKVAFPLRNIYNDEHSHVYDLLTENLIGKADATTVGG